MRIVSYLLVSLKIAVSKPNAQTSREYKSQFLLLKCHTHLILHLSV